MVFIRFLDSSRCDGVRFTFSGPMHFDCTALECTRRLVTGTKNSANEHYNAKTGTQKARSARVAKVLFALVRYTPAHCSGAD